MDNEEKKPIQLSLGEEDIEFLKEYAKIECLTDTIQVGLKHMIAQAKKKFKKEEK